jgi:hypothetical protein
MECVTCEKLFEQQSSYLCSNGHFVLCQPCLYEWIKYCKNIKCTCPICRAEYINLPLKQEASYNEDIIGTHIHIERTDWTSIVGSNYDEEDDNFSYMRSNPWDFLNELMMWNVPAQQQAIGRAIRSNSHSLTGNNHPFLGVSIDSLSETLMDNQMIGRAIRSNSHSLTGNNHPFLGVSINSLFDTTMDNQMIGRVQESNSSSSRVLINDVQIQPWSFDFSHLDTLMEQKEKNAKKLTNQMIGIW